jgi:hypothetical protein
MVGVAADRGLKRGGEALGEQSGIVGSAAELVGIDDLGALLVRTGDGIERIVSGEVTWL